MNSLQYEKSTYLKQHAENPFEWMAWRPENLNRAKELQRPIMLSIGYSACHWCHEMSRQAFSDQATADFFNQNFVNIKIDREEFPDVDYYFQQIAQVTGSRGGWPLTVFLNDEMEVFFVGTYFSAKSTENNPSLLELGQNLLNIYKNQNADIKQRYQTIKQELLKKPEIKNKIQFQGHFPSAAAIIKAIESFKDKDNGGWGVAPRFPTFPFYEWACEQILEGKIEETDAQFVLESIEKMFMGGLYDHARGGIHRYSTDQKWLVPHFEKMLFDQAGLIRTLSKASLIYQSPLFFDSLIQTLDFLETEMRHEDGYFFTSQDAESEEVEGLYYTYTEDEFEAALINENPEWTEAELDKFKKWFGITKSGNFQKKLNVVHLVNQYKNEFYQPEVWSEIRKIKQAIHEDRKDRIPPKVDNKAIASWNFQILTALCDCIQYCRIESIKMRAWQIYSTAIDKIHKTFLKTDDSQQTQLIQHSTTLNDRSVLFEDYVCFLELQVRSYELSSNAVFFDNALQTLKFIFKEFFKDGHVFQNATSMQEFQNHPNLIACNFDQSSKSSLASFIFLLYKFQSAGILKIEEHLNSEYIAYLKNSALANPLASGEMLRALTFPDIAFKKIEVPAKWSQNPKFQQIMGHLSSRFFICYQNNDESSWQICNLNECEIQGKSEDEFYKLFQQPEQEQA